MTPPDEPTFADIQPTGPDHTDPAHAELAHELVTMTAEDHAAQAGAVGGTVDQQFAWRRVTTRNGDRLAEILDEIGWPTPGLVGDEASRCAWLIAQHADRQLEVQRRALALMEAAAGEVSAMQVAFLRDRVLVNEGRPQIYGTQIANVVDGVPVPWPVRDAALMDAKRAEVGIEPFDVHVSRFAPTRH